MGLTLLPLHTQNLLEPAASPGAQGTAGLGSGCILHSPVLHKVLAQVLGSALPPSLTALLLNPFRSPGQQVQVPKWDLGTLCRNPFQVRCHI